MSWQFGDREKVIEKDRRLVTIYSLHIECGVQQFGGGSDTAAW